MILLLNRRGFSTHIQCPACAHVVRCPSCEVSLTDHRDRELAVCHYCEYEIATPRVCPECKFEGIRYSGLGTQKLESEVRRLFAGATVIRMDSDTMRRPGSHERSLQAFREGRALILVGTQMIAKGLDFPNVTVVGVINADTALHLPDFRASERTFQLVTQVAGRTGRGDRGGVVYVQTLNPDHPAIRAAERHDYLAFVKQELPTRKMFHYPPAGELIRIIVRGPDEPQVAAFAQQMADWIRSKATGTFRLLGPAPAPMAKLRGHYRHHLLFVGESLAELKPILRAATDEVRPPADVLWQADIDALDMM